MDGGDTAGLPTLHVVPENDLVAHDTSGGDCACACGPDLEECPGGWLVIHHSMDNRETREQ